MDNKKGLVSIILLNCNGKRWNKNCIDSLLLQTYKNYEIIFVNNMSTDGSLEEVQDLYEKEIKIGKIKIILNPRNTGFAGGNNLGVKNVNKDSEYICLLNNDTVVEKDWLKCLVDGILSDDSLGAVGSFFIGNDGEEGTKKLLKDKNVKEVISPYSWISLEKLDCHDKKNIVYTNFICGCSFLYKKNIIDKPFEDSYFIYCEDTYLSWRILMLGYKLGLCKDSYVKHYGGGTFGKYPSKGLYHANKNLITNFYAFFHGFTFFVLLPRFIISLLLVYIKNINRLDAILRSWKWIFYNRKNISNIKKKIKKNAFISQGKFLDYMPKRFLTNYYFVGDKKIYHYPIIIIVGIINIVYKLYISFFKIFIH